MVIALFEDAARRTAERRKGVSELLDVLLEDGKAHEERERALEQFRKAVSGEHRKVLTAEVEKRLSKTMLTEGADSETRIWAMRAYAVLAGSRIDLVSETTAVSIANFASRDRENVDALYYNRNRTPREVVAAIALANPVHARAMMNEAISNDNNAVEIIRRMREAGKDNVLTSENVNGWHTHREAQLTIGVIAKCNPSIINEKVLENVWRAVVPPGYDRYASMTAFDTLAIIASRNRAFVTPEMLDKVNGILRYYGQTTDPTKQPINPIAKSVSYDLISSMEKAARAMTDALTIRRFIDRFKLDTVRKNLNKRLGLTPALQDVVAAKALSI